MLGRRGLGVAMRRPSSAPGSEADRRDSPRRAHIRPAATSRAVIPPHHHRDGSTIRHGGIRRSISRARPQSCGPGGRRCSGAARPRRRGGVVGPSYTNDPIGGTPRIPVGPRPRSSTWRRPPAKPAMTVSAHRGESMDRRLQPQRFLDGGTLSSGCDDGLPGLRMSPAGAATRGSRRAAAVPDRALRPHAA